MYTPALYRKNFFDSLFDFAPVSAFSSANSAMMRTDIRENDDGFTVDIDMPGVKKEDIKLQLKDSLLTISAEVNSASDDQAKTGSFLHRERFSGSFTRSFTISEDITDEDISAHFNNGVLTLFIPKKPHVIPADNTKYIPIGD